MIHIKYLYTVIAVSLTLKAFMFYHVKFLCIDSYIMHSDHNGVPIVSAGGEVNVKVKIKQCENISGPKLDVDVVLGTLHLLLYPQQVHSLTELISGIISNGLCECVFIDESVIIKILNIKIYRVVNKGLVYITHSPSARALCKLNLY